MNVYETIQSVDDALAPWRTEGSLALVPTMGNLHAGHLALMNAARAKADKVVASIFVNPLQFGPNEDYASYPRTLANDLEKLEQAGVDAVFIPSNDEMYSAANSVFVKVAGLSDILCGVSRPQHFQGVATVVTKLFHIIQPHLVFFGEKDYQQLTIIRRLVADLNFPLQVEPVPTVRESSGLALSSRNRYLNAQEHACAPELQKTLQQLARQWQHGQRDYQGLEAEGVQRLLAAGFKPDYVAIRRCTDLQTPQADGESLIILAAAFLGKTRLIDNCMVS